MIKKIIFSVMWLLTISITLAQSSDFNTTYTRLIEWMFDEGTGSVSTGTMVDSWVLNLSIKGQFPEMKWWINMSMKIPYTTYSNDTKAYQSYSKISIDATIGGSFEAFTIPNTPISIEMETIILSHYMYYKVKRLDFDLSKWDNSNEDLLYIKEFLLSDWKKVYMNRWIRSRVPQESQEIIAWWYNTFNLKEIKDILLKNPIFKEIGVNTKWYIITFNESNLEKILSTEFIDRLNEIKNRTNAVEEKIALINSGNIFTYTGILITGTMTTWSIPTVEFLLSEEKNTITMNMNKESISLNSNMHLNDEKIKINFSINNIWDQSYKLWLWVNYLHMNNNNNLDFLIENTASYLSLGKNIKIRTPMRAKSIEQIMSEVL